MGNICTYRFKNPNFSINITIRDQYMTDHDFVSGQYHSLNALQSKNYLSQLVFNSRDPTAKQQQALLQAKESNDIQFLIQNINDETFIQQALEIDHQWVSNPKCLGSIATMYLGLNYMKYNEQNQNIDMDQDEYINLLDKSIQLFSADTTMNKIKINLNKKSIDLVQLTVLLLVFLVENLKLREAIIRNQIFELIIKKMNKTIDYNNGFRIACGFILRELYRENQQLIEIFLGHSVSLESIIDFIDQYNKQAIQEGLNMIEDIIYNYSLKNQINKQNCKKLFDLGIFVHLQDLVIKLQSSKLLDNETQQYDQEFRKNTIQQANDLMKILVQNSQK